MRLSNAFALLLLLCSGAVALETTLIDDFAQNQVPLILFYDGVDSSEGALQTQVNGILGDERDVLMTLTDGSLSGSVALLSIVNDELSVSMPLTAVGNVRISWDGFADGDFSAVDVSPGLGPVDLTVDNGYALVLPITFNGPFEATFTVYSGSDTSTFTISRAAPAARETAVFEMPFADFQGTADFTAVDAIGVELPFNGHDGAIVVDLGRVTVFAYQVCGHVFDDSNGNGIQDGSEMDLPGVNVDILQSPSPSPLDSTLTDASGDFCFTGFPSGGTFNACVNDDSFMPTLPADGCQVFSLSNRNDVTDIVLGQTTAGGGADPHIFSPHIDHQGIEMVKALEHNGLVSRQEILSHATSALLIDAADITVTALLGDGSGLRKDGVYFTELSFEPTSGATLVLFTQMADDGSDGTLAVRYKGRTTACSRTENEQLRYAVGDSEVVVDCGSQQPAYEANWFMMRAWPHQAPYAQGHVTVRGPTTHMEIFYMQRQYVAARNRWVGGVPFGFFNMQATPVKGVEYAGLFGNAMGATARSAVDGSADSHEATAQFIAAQLR